MENPEARWVVTDCSICYHSCGSRVLVEDGRITQVEGLEEHPLNQGALCPKGRKAIDFVYHPDRLKYPQKKVNGQWQRVTWDDALSEIAEKLGRLKDEFGPEALGIFAGSIGVENIEMVQLAQRFKGAFGTPNFISVEGICYRMRIRSRQLTFGKYPVEEMDSKLYILWGHNPDQSDFPFSLSLERNLKTGSKLVVIDPKRIAAANKADMYLPIRPGTDGALALAMIHVIIKENLYDKDFVERWTHGFERLVPHVEQYTPEWAEKITWVPAEDTRKLARLYAQSESASIFQGTSTQDQTANGPQTSRAFSILQVITGNINNPGGWVISPRLRLTGIGLASDKTPIGVEDYPLFYELWGRKSPYGQVMSLPDSVPDPIRALIVTGGNPLITLPDSQAFRAAFQKLDLLVVHDLYHTETAEPAHYLLPACTHLEKNGLAYSYNVCHGVPYLMLKKKAIEPLYESRSEFMLWTELAKKMGMGDLFPWKTDEELVELELQPSGLDFKELKEAKANGDFYMEKQYGMDAYEEKGFSTPSRKIEIYSGTLEEAGFDPLPTYREPDQSPLGGPDLVKSYPLVLTTGSRILYFSGGQHRNIPELRSQYPDPLAEVHPNTAARFGVQEGDWIMVESPRGRIRVKARVTEDMVEEVVSVPHGWSGEANANILTDANLREPIMGYPQMKSQLCRISKA